MDLNSMSLCIFKEKGTLAFMYFSKNRKLSFFLLFVRSDLKKRHSFDGRLKGKITFTTIIHFCLQMCCDCLYKQFICQTSFIFMGAVTFSFQRNFYEAINCKMLPAPDKSKIIPPLSVQKSQSPQHLPLPPLSVIFALNDLELIF